MPERDANQPDDYAVAAAELRGDGYVFIPSPHPGYWASPREQELMRLLDEAVEWAQRPSPIPAVPFDEFLGIVAKFGAGPRGDSRIKEALADA